MGTLVCFHAHPDDEAIATGGLMAKAAADGHRVVLVVATRGELGEIVPGVLVDGEQLALRRTAETYESAGALGVSRVEFLGYVDSGMMGEPTNDAPWCFWQADPDSAARRLAAILEEEQADLLTVYDDHGGYGHPDHIQVHRVGRRAGEIAGTPAVLAHTMNRDAIRRSMAENSDLLPDSGGPADLPDDFGSPESEITHLIDVAAHVDDKRRAMRCHRSQMADDHFLLAMPDEMFSVAFGTECYIAIGDPDAGSLNAVIEPAKVD